MAIDPITGMMLGQIGSSFLGGKMAPEAQEMNSFGSGAVNNSMNTAQNKLSNFDNFYQQYMQQPVSLPSSFVQQPGGYSGPNLPMSFGVSGSDPALNNPSLLQSGGFDFGPRDPRANADSATMEERKAVSRADRPARGDRADPYQEATDALRILGFRGPQGR